MKFEITKTALVEGLSKVSKVVSAKSSLPILQGILVEANEEEINLTGSDANETIIHSIPVNDEDIRVIETGRTVLPRQAIDIAKKSRKHLSISLNESITMIKSGQSEIELNSLDPDEYPAFPEVGTEQPSLVMNGNQFKDLVNKTSFAASRSESRPILQGVLYDVTEDCINLSSTDSHRLAVVKHKVENSHDIRLVVPAGSLENAVKIFDFQEDVMVYAKSERSIILRNGPTMYLSRLLEGNYPDTSRLIPDSFKAIMKINRKEFLDGLELINQVANNTTTSESGVAKLHVNGVASLSSSKGETGKGKIDIPYESVEGKENEFTISFSVKYAIESLKALDCETVDFKFTGQTRPFLLTPDELTDIEESQLILPVRTV